MKPNRKGKMKIQFTLLLLLPLLFLRVLLLLPHSFPKQVAAEAVAEVFRFTSDGRRSFVAATVRLHTTQ